jgi:hypothetical protein
MGLQRRQGRRSKNLAACKGLEGGLFADGKRQRELLLLLLLLLQIIQSSWLVLQLEIRTHEGRQPPKKQTAVP